MSQTEAIALWELIGLSGDDVPPAAFWAPGPGLTKSSEVRMGRINYEGGSILYPLDASFPSPKLGVLVRPVPKSEPSMVSAHHLANSNGDLQSKTIERGPGLPLIS